MGYNLSGLIHLKSQLISPQDLLWLKFSCMTCGPVDRVLDSRSKGLGFDSQCWPCVEVLGKLRIPHCLGPPSRNGYLVHRSKARWCCPPCQGKGKVCWTSIVIYLFTFNINGIIYWNHALVNNHQSGVLWSQMVSGREHLCRLWTRVPFGKEKEKKMRRGRLWLHYIPMKNAPFLLPTLSHLRSMTYGVVISCMVISWKDYAFSANYARWASHQAKWAKRGRKNTVNMYPNIQILHIQAQRKKATIHQPTTMLSTSKNVLFPGHNYLLTTSADDPTLWLSSGSQRGW